MNLERQKNRKIFNQIDKLSSKGKNYVLDYYRLIDEIIAKGDYGYFESTLNEYFKIDINHYQTVQDVKKKTWDKIVLQSNDSFTKRLKKLYDSKGVYQIGYNIFINSTGELLGKIIEQEIYTIESKYYVKNKQLAKLKNTVITNLEVEKLGTYIFINNNDNSLNEDQNLLKRYEIAIDYLLVNSNYVGDYVDDYVE